MKSLKELFGSSDGKDALGSGMARKGAETVGARKAYTDYVIAQNEQGMPAVSFIEYAKGKR